MPFTRNPGPGPSEVQARDAFRQAVNAVGEIKADPAASAEELQDMKHAREVAREWMRQAEREAEAG